MEYRTRGLVESPPIKEEHGKKPTESKNYHFDETLFKHVTVNQYIEGLLKHKDYVLDHSGFEYLNLYSLFNRKPLSEEITHEEIEDNSKGLQAKLLKKGFEEGKEGGDLFINVSKGFVNGESKEKKGLVKKFNIPSELNLRKGDELKLVDRNGINNIFIVEEEACKDGSVVLKCTEGGEKAKNKEFKLSKQSKGKKDGWLFNTVEKREKTMLISRDGQDKYCKHSGNIDGIGGKFDWLHINKGYDKTKPLRRYYLDVKMSKMHDIFYDLYKSFKKRGVKIGMKVIDHAIYDRVDDEPIERLDEIIIYCNPEDDHKVKNALAAVHSKYREDFNIEETHYMGSCAGYHGINIGEESTNRRNSSNEFIENYKRDYGFKIGKGEEINIEHVMNEKGSSESYTMIRSSILDQALFGAAQIFSLRKNATMNGIKLDELLGIDVDDDRVWGTLKKDYSLIITSELFKVILRRLCVAYNINPDAIESNLLNGYRDEIYRIGPAGHPETVEKVIETKKLVKGQILKIRTAKGKYFEFLVLKNNGDLHIKCIAGLKDYVDSEFTFSGKKIERSNKIRLKETTTGKTIKIQISQLDEVRL